MAQAAPRTGCRGMGLPWQRRRGQSGCLSQGCKHEKTQNFDLWRVPGQTQKCRHSRSA